MSLGRVAVIGAGQMGYELCVQFAVMGEDVVLIDHREANLEPARTRIESAVEFLDHEGLANAEPDAVIENIEFTTDLAGGVADADVVLETVPLVTRAVLQLWRDTIDAGDGGLLQQSNPP